jgi:hypothetical protein
MATPCQTAAARLLVQTDLIQTLIVPANNATPHARIALEPQPKIASPVRALLTFRVKYVLQAVIQDFMEILLLILAKLAPRIALLATAQPLITAQPALPPS